MDTRDSKGRFTKGNPGGGRKKKDPMTRDLLRELSPQAVARLGNLIHSDDEAVALQASFDILELALKYDIGSKFHSKAEGERKEDLNELMEAYTMLGRAKEYVSFVKKLAYQAANIFLPDEWEDVITGRVTKFSARA